MGGQGARMKEQGVQQLTLNHHAPDGNSKEIVNSKLRARL